MNAAREQGGSHVGQLRLQRLRAGELGGEEASETRAHIDGCSACRARLDGLEHEQRAFERAIPFERFAGGVERARRVPRALPRRTFTWAGGASVCAAAAVLLIVRPTPPSHNARKSGAVDVTVRIGGVAADSQRTALPGRPEPLAAGERVRIGHRAFTPRRLVALSIDEAGAVTALYPERGPALEIGPSDATTYLPDSVEFTGRGRERLYVLTTDRALDVATATAAVAAAYARAHGDLTAMPTPSLDDTADVSSWLFSKP